MHDLVFHGRDAQGSTFAVGLGDVVTPHVRGAVASLAQAFMQVDQLLRQAFAIVVPAHRIHSGRRSLVQTVVALVQHRQTDHPTEAAEPVTRFPFRFLIQGQQGA